MMKAIFSSVGSSISLEDFPNVFEYYLQFFKIYQNKPKSPIAEGAVLQLLFLAVKMFSAQKCAGDSISKLHSAMMNKCQDFPAFNDFMNNEGAEIFAEYQGSLNGIRNNFDKEFLGFVENYYETA